MAVDVWSGGTPIGGDPPPHKPALTDAEGNMGAAAVLALILIVGLTFALAG